MKQFLMLVFALLMVACDGKNGKDGHDGVNGVQGPQGQTGPQGIPGINGSNGADGTTFLTQVTDLINLLKVKESAVIDIECSSWRGSGTKIDNNRIVTARHVTESAGFCQYYSGPKLIASGGSVLNAASGRDIAVISVANKTSDWVSVPSISRKLDSTVYVGQFLALLSVPMDLYDDVQYSLGFVTDNSLLSVTDPKWSGSFASDMAAAGGSSGAPIFNINGEFIGIHVGGYSNGGLELNIQILFKTSDNLL